MWNNQCFCLHVYYVNHARIRSWNQPVVSIEGKVLKQQREPLIRFELTTDCLRFRHATWLIQTLVIGVKYDTFVGRQKHVKKILFVLNIRKITLIMYMPNAYVFSMCMYFSLPWLESKTYTLIDWRRLHLNVQWVHRHFHRYKVGIMWVFFVWFVIILNCLVLSSVRIHLIIHTGVLFDSCFYWTINSREVPDHTSQCGTECDIVC